MIDLRAWRGKFALFYLILLPSNVWFAKANSEGVDGGQPPQRFPGGTGRTSPGL